MLSKINAFYQLQAISPAQREQWEHFVAGHVHGHLLQSWDWGELKAMSGWRPVRLALWSQGRIVAGAQVLRRTLPHVPLQAGHLAYIPRGPVIDWSQAPLCDAFFVQLHTYLRRRGALALHLEPGPISNTAQGELAVDTLNRLNLHPVRTVQPRRTIMLDLAPDEEGLLAQMKEKWRYNLRLAARKGVNIRVAETCEDVHAWYQLLQATGERDGFGIHTCSYYERIWQLFAPQDQLQLLLAEYQGQLLAGIFVSLYAHEAIYLYGASGNEQRQLMPNYLLQWEAMRWARKQGAYRYDFWGIPETDAEDEALAGVYRFKRGWGGSIVEFPGGHEHIYRPLMMKIARRLI